MEIKSSQHSGRRARVFIVRATSIILDKIVIVFLPDLKTLGQHNILSPMGNVDHKIGSRNWTEAQQFS